MIGRLSFVAILGIAVIRRDSAWVVTLSWLKFGPDDWRGLNSIAVFQLERDRARVTSNKLMTLPQTCATAESLISAKITVDA